MACSNSNCQSGCYRDEEENPLPGRQTNVSIDVDLEGSGCYRDEEENPLPGRQTNVSIDVDLEGQNICVKCKVGDAIAGGVAGGGDGQFCAQCFRASLFGKFRVAVASNGMISPSDKILVAFSGGPSSRVALQFVHEMQQKAQKNFDASRDKSVPVFGVGVTFIDESSVHNIPESEMDKVIQQIKFILLDLDLPKKEFHVVPIEGIYSSSGENGKDMLKKLLNAVGDVTGKEDLLLHMRMLSLQKIALENGYNKLILGSCTSRIACHVIAATVKGLGYSLPADIQHVDSRWKVPVLLPLRDCLAQELNMLCRFEGWKSVGITTDSFSGINQLVSSFVTLLQEENPSRECTIVRTAGKLIPFNFNKLPEADDPKARSESQRRQRKFNIKSEESTPPEFFCAICNSPLDKTDLSSSNSSASRYLPVDNFGATCCSNCRFQILPDDPSSMRHFCSLLPLSSISQAHNGVSDHRILMEQIQDFILSDNED